MDICKSGVHCQACRTSQPFRASIVRSKLAKDERFECPRGLPIAETPEERQGLGTLLEKVIGKIPFVKMLPCYDAAGKLKPESGCGKRRDALNRIGK